MDYLLHCAHCNNKLYTDGRSLDLYEIPTACPQLKIGSAELLPRTKRFRCPQCGHIFRILKTGEEKPSLDLT